MDNQNVSTFSPPSGFEPIRTAAPPQGFVSTDAWKQAQTDEAATLDRLADENSKTADEHIKNTSALVARFLRHIHTATGPGGIAAPVDDATREGYRKTADLVEKNGLDRVSADAPHPPDEVLSKEGYRRLARSIERNGLDAVHKL